MRQAEDQSAVLVIRAWHEEGSPSGAVRARLTQTPDSTVPGWDQVAADGEEAIVAAVRRWLREFTQR